MVLIAIFRKAWYDLIYLIATTSWKLQFKTKIGPQWRILESIEDLNFKFVIEIQIQADKKDNTFFIHNSFGKLICFTSEDVSLDRPNQWYPLLILLDFWKIKFEKSSLTNWIFSPFWTRFLLLAKIQFKMDKWTKFIQFVKVDFSKLIFQKSSTNQPVLQQVTKHWKFHWFGIFFAENCCQCSGSLQTTWYVWVKKFKSWMDY